MKNVASLFLLLTIISCKEEKPTIPSENETGTLTLSIDSRFNDLDFILNQVYTLNDTMSIRVEGLKFYISNVCANSIKSVGLSLYENDDDYSFELAPGSYSSLSFNLGLDSITNHGDPSLHISSNPLSSFNDTHWSWAQGYKFVLIDGKFDSDGDNIPDQSFSYHIGNDDYLKLVELNTTFSVLENETTHIYLSFNVAKTFDGVDIKNKTFTHSTGQFELVEQLASNCQSAFSINE
jgi:hypothetical protein